MNVGIRNMINHSTGNVPWMRRKYDVLSPRMPWFDSDAVLASGCRDNKHALFDNS